VPTLPENFIRVVMLRPDLENIPAFSFAAGYRLRSFRDGDRDTWIGLHQLAEPYVAVDGTHFDSAFGADLPALPRRSMFLVAPDGRDCGTITAWYNRRLHGRPWGQIHWVSVLPEHRGKGLSKAMTAAALRRLRALGHRRAMLNTQVPRTAAIKTYLDCGFVPDLAAPEAAAAWEIVRRSIRHGGLGNA
jgi:GNAT superfamily N-acetyltransferase